MHWNKPKSVRQIGSVPGKDRVYTEDYVMRFAKQLAAQSAHTERAAVLLGGVYTYNSEKIYQISGIVEIPGFAGRVSPKLSSDTWHQIFTEIKENFTDLEIVGWFYTYREFTPQDANSLLEIHKANFQHRDKVLFLYDQQDQENEFFLYRNGRLEKQKGHFVYYEKNPEMLRYMEKENNRHVHLVEQEDDRVLRNIRGIIAEKEKQKDSRKKWKKREAGFGHSMVAVLLLIVLVMGATALRNQSVLNKVTKQLGQIQQMTIGPSKQNKENTETVVETLSGNVEKQNPSGGAISGAAVTGQSIQ